MRVGNVLTRRGIRFMSSSQAGPVIDPPRFSNFQTRLQPATLVRILSPIGVLGLCIYSLPQFSTTREGITVAFQWKELTPEDNFFESFAWQLWMGAAGLLAGTQVTNLYIQKQSRTYSSLLPLKVPLMVFGGVLGAKLTISLAAPATDVLMLCGRCAEFGFDGLMADFLNKPRHELSWVKQNVYLRNHQEPRKKSQIFQSSGHLLRDLTMVPGPLTASTNPDDIGPYGFKLLLVKELGRLRAQEETIKASSSMDPKVKDKFVSEIAVEKARVKQLCKDKYKQSASKILQEVFDDATKELSEIRLRQVNMALSQQCKISELRKLDQEKATLKAQAKLALGVKLSKYTKPCPKWTKVWKDVSVANKV